LLAKRKKRWPQQTIFANPPNRSTVPVQIHRAARIACYQPPRFASLFHFAAEKRYHLTNSSIHIDPDGRGKTSDQA